MQMTAPTIYFDAVLHPHRSLSPVGFYILMAAIATISFTAGIAFWLAGAWPVLGFFGLDVVLIYIAFRLNYRSGRQLEHILLSDSALTVSRRDPAGRIEHWRFEPYWVRVDLADSAPGTQRLSLASHGHAVQIGAFLTTEERAELAGCLKDALRRQRLAATGEA